MICLSGINNLILERSKTIDKKEKYKDTYMANYLREIMQRKYRSFDYTKENIKAKNTDHLDLVFMLVKE